MHSRKPQSHDTVLRGQAAPQPPRRTGRPRRRLVQVLGILLAVAILALLAHFVDLHATLRTLAGIDPLAVVLATVVALFDRYVMSSKWNVLLRLRGTALSNLGAYRIYLASGFVGYVLPLGLGSDVFRATRLSLGGYRTSNVSASILLERVLGLLAILSLGGACLAWLVATGRSDLIPLLATTAGLWAVGVVATLVSMSNRLFRFVRSATSSIAGNRFVRMLYALHDEYVGMSQYRAVLLGFWLLSMLEQLVSVLIFVPILMSLHAPLDLVALCALLPLCKAFLQFMPVPAGIGIVEGSIVVALSLAQVPAAQGLAVALIMRAIDIIMLVPMGIAYAVDTARLRRESDPA